MTGNVYWMITARVKTGRLAELKGQIAALIEKTENEPGALSYDFWFSQQETRLHVHERFRDSASAIAHLRNVRREIGPFMDTIEMDPFVVMGDVDAEARALFSSLGAEVAQFAGGLERALDVAGPGR